METSKEANPGPPLKDAVDVSCQKVFPIIRKRERPISRQVNTQTEMIHLCSWQHYCHHNSQKVGITQVSMNR